MASKRAFDTETGTATDPINKRAKTESRMLDAAIQTEETNLPFMKPHMVDGATQTEEMTFPQEYGEDCEISVAYSASSQGTGSLDEVKPQDGTSQDEEAEEGDTRQAAVPFMPLSWFQTIADCKAIIANPGCSLTEKIQALENKYMPCKQLVCDLITTLNSAVPRMRSESHKKSEFLFNALIASDPNWWKSYWPTIRDLQLKDWAIQRTTWEIRAMDPESTSTPTEESSS